MRSRHAFRAIVLGVGLAAALAVSPLLAAERGGHPVTASAAQAPRASVAAPGLLRARLLLALRLLQDWVAPETPELPVHTQGLSDDPDPVGGGQSDGPPDNGGGPTKPTGDSNAPPEGASDEGSGSGSVVHLQFKGA